ncbi:MAG: 16S rRNA (cytosine(967)-C(5))-methyltransferase [Cyanophyceae cyanobacterium]
MSSAANPRQLAFRALRSVYRQEAYTDVALDRVLSQAHIKTIDRGLFTELVYGTVRRQRSLDALIDQLGTKKAVQQPPDLRIILHLGLYQLRYLTQVPAAAAVDTSVELAKQNRLAKLSGVVNGLLRHYERLSRRGDPLVLPDEPHQRIGILHSFPDWLIETWGKQIGLHETEQLCHWFNHPPPIDLRVNILQTSVDKVEATLIAAGVAVERVPHLPQSLRLTGGTRSIEQLPGFAAGWWTVQDSSAQLVTHLLAPQPGEVIIDACAAPGGKTTHIAELMGDRGQIWACDRAASRLRKLKANSKRLQLQSIIIHEVDSRQFQFPQRADRVLIDAPCSGLGTLHRRPDIRWRQSPDRIQELSELQYQLLAQAATWVKPGGTLVYATCTLSQPENEAVLHSFLNYHPHWQIEIPSEPIADYVSSSGWIKVLPHHHQMDGFFMVKLKQDYLVKEQ